MTTTGGGSCGIGSSDEGVGLDFHASSRTSATPFAFATLDPRARAHLPDPRRGDRRWHRDARRARGGDRRSRRPARRGRLEHVARRDVARASRSRSCAAGRDRGVPDPLRPEPAAGPLGRTWRRRARLCLELAAGATLLKCNLGEARWLTGVDGGEAEEVATALAELGPRLVVVTAGTEPAVAAGRLRGRGRAAGGRDGQPARRGRLPSWGRSPPGCLRRRAGDSTDAGRGDRARRCAPAPRHARGSERSTEMSGGGERGYARGRGGGTAEASDLDARPALPGAEGMAAAVAEAGAGDPRPAPRALRLAAQRPARRPGPRARADDPLPEHQRQQPRRRLPAPARPLRRLDGDPRRADRGGDRGDPPRRPGATRRPRGSRRCSPSSATEPDLEWLRETPRGGGDRLPHLAARASAARRPPA